MFWSIGATFCPGRGLQLWAVKIHESLPHNVAFQRIYTTAEVAFFFFFFFPKSEEKARRQGISGSRALKEITWNLGTFVVQSEQLDEFVSYLGQSRQRHWGGSEFTGDKRQKSLIHSFHEVKLKST